MWRVCGQGANAHSNTHQQQHTDTHILRHWETRDVTTEWSEEKAMEREQVERKWRRRGECVSKTRRRRVEKTSVHGEQTHTRHTHSHRGHNTPHTRQNNPIHTHTTHHNTTQQRPSKRNQHSHHTRTDRQRQPDTDDRKVTSEDDPRTENEKTIETHKECANAAENSVPRQARIVEKSGCNKTWDHERNT